MRYYQTIFTCIGLVLSSFVAVGAAIPEPDDASIAWIAKGEFCEPETVFPLPDNTLLVSNVCDFRALGNGFLTLLSGEGKALDWRVVDKLDAPLGMALVGDRLHVVDRNRVKVFRWPGYEPLETIELDTAVANDVAVSADGTIYVTDTAGDKVVRRLPDGSQSLLVDKPLFRGANGIAVDDEYLYIGGERLWRVHLLEETIETIGPDWITDIDGIEVEADGVLQITPVGGPLIRYRNDDEIEVLGGEGISSANHGYAPDLGLALIPTGFDNTVIAIRISDSMLTDERGD